MQIQEWTSSEYCFFRLNTGHVFIHIYMHCSISSVLGFDTVSKEYPAAIFTVDKVTFWQGTEGLFQGLGASGPQGSVPKYHSVSLAYPEGGFEGVQTPPEIIPKFWQSLAEFPVPWKMHPKNLIRIRVSPICILGGTPD
jgi:hypothetical protein